MRHVLDIFQPADLQIFATRAPFIFPYAADYRHYFVDITFRCRHRYFADHFFDDDFDIAFVAITFSAPPSISRRDMVDMLLMPLGFFDAADAVSRFDVDAAYAHDAISLVAIVC